MAKRLSPLIWALAASRLLVLAAGAAGALFVKRLPGWTMFDPTRLSSSFGSVGNVLLASSVRWDSIHYLEIAAHGYRHAGDTVFFPLYPLLIAAVGFVVRSDAAAGVLISLTSFGIAMALLHRLTEREFNRAAADATVLLLAFAPLSFFFSAVYTESLFLALSVGAIYCARLERWAPASILAALAALTRIPGVLLFVPIGILYVNTYRRPDRRLAWLLLPPAALAGFLAYLADRGYGWLAPINNQTGDVHLHRLDGPIATIIAGLKAAETGLRETVQGVKPFSPALGSPFSQGFENLVLVCTLVLLAVTLVAVWRRLPAAYGAYATLVVALCLWSQVVAEPLKSLDRYALVIFPAWMVAGAWLSERKAVRAITIVGAILLTFYSVESTTWAFIA